MNVYKEISLCIIDACSNGHKFFSSHIQNCVSKHILVNVFKTKNEY